MTERSHQAVLDELIGQEFPVLGQGSVALVDCMGDDHAIAEAARVSYGKGTQSVSSDAALIRYLMRHHHSSPFEQCAIKLAILAPIDVWRQLERHRAGRITDEMSTWNDPSVNEYSTRYSEAIDLMTTTPPDRWRAQATENKQGSSGFIKATDDGLDLTSEEYDFQKQARQVYRHRLDAGVAREQARKDLPLCTFTKGIWTCDLRNTLHMLGLRLDLHAQEEIRSLAQTIASEIVAKLFPIAWEAFHEYVLEAVTLSQLDIMAIRLNIESLQSHSPVHDWTDLFSNKRERDECRDKMARLGLAGALPP